MKIENSTLVAAGKLLATAMKGDLQGSSVGDLVRGCAEIGLIPAPEMVPGTGFVTLPTGERKEVAFQVRKGAGKMEIDAALFQAIKGVLEIGYLVERGAS